MSESKVRSSNFTDLLTSNTESSRTNSDSRGLLGERSTSKAARLLLKWSVLVLTLFVLSGNPGYASQEQRFIQGETTAISGCFEVRDTMLYPAANEWLLQATLEVIKPSETTGKGFEATWDIPGAGPRVVSWTSVLSQTLHLYFDLDYSFTTASDSLQADKEQVFWEQQLLEEILTSSGTTLDGEVYCNCSCENRARTCEPFPQVTLMRGIQSAFECVRTNPGMGRASGDTIEVCGTNLTKDSALVVIRGQPEDSLLFNEELKNSEIQHYAASLVNRYSPSNVPRVIVLVLGRDHLLRTDDIEKQGEELNSRVAKLAGDRRFYVHLVPMQGGSAGTLAAEAKEEVERTPYLQVSVLLPKLLTRAQAKQANLRIANKESSCESIKITIPPEPSQSTNPSPAITLLALRFLPQALLYLLVPLVVLAFGLISYRHDFLGTRKQLDKKLRFPWDRKDQ